MPRSVARPSVLLVAGLAFLACDESTQPSPPPQTQSAAALEMQAGDSQFATVGQTVPVPPAVLVVDTSGRGVGGVTVTFAVTSGGGNATGTTAVSDTAGVARVGSWTLGPDLGAQTMTATVSGQPDVDPFRFIATAMCDCWESGAALPGPRFKGGSAVIDGKLYVAGEDGWVGQLPLEVYDPSSNTWTARGLLPEMHDASVAALDGQLYLMAGMPTSTPDPWLQVYNPATDQWTPRAAPPTQRSQFRIAAVGGLLYALGGLGEGGALRTVEAYDPATDTWTTKAPMLRGRQWMAVAEVDGILYVIGGTGPNAQGWGNTNVLSSVEAYDPATDTWTERASLPHPIMASAAAVVEGIIYLTGGGRFWSTASADAFAYDPKTDKWTVQPPMRVSRHDAISTALDGTVYVIGGITHDDQGGHALARVDVYRPHPD
jgi:N-acetylneuraminic acid mutarotase